MSLANNFQVSIEKITPLFLQYRTIVLYFLIGGSAAILDMVGFYVGYSLFDLASPLATTISVSVATLYSFLLNSFINFKTVDRLGSRFVSFVIVSGIGMLISIASLWLLNVQLGWNGNIVKIGSLPVIFLVQYLLNKKITFRQ